MTALELSITGRSITGSARDGGVATFWLEQLSAGSVGKLDDELHACVCVCVGVGVGVGVGMGIGMGIGRAETLLPLRGW